MTFPDSVVLPDVLRGLVEVVPDDDPAAGNEPGVVAMSDYRQAMIGLYGATVLEGIASLLAELAADDDPGLRAKARTTDIDYVAARVFERDVRPMLEAHFEAGEAIFDGRSVDH